MDGNKKLKMYRVGSKVVCIGRMDDVLEYTHPIIKIKFPKGDIKEVNVEENLVEEVLIMRLKVLETLLENTELFRDGLCGWSYHLFVKGLIKRGELNIFTDLLETTLPSNIEVDNLERYSWEPGEVEPRIQWIEDQISVIKNELKTTKGQE